MLATIRSAAVIGIDAYDVSVEVDCAQGLPQFTVVGLPAGAVKESRERVSAAIVNAGFLLPARRTTVNLAPAARTSAMMELRGDAASACARACRSSLSAPMGE